MNGPSPDEVRARLGPRLMAPDAAFNAPGFWVGNGAGEKLLRVAEHGAAFRPAAVLVALITHEGEITVLQRRSVRSRRPDQLSRRAGGRRR